MAGKDFAFSPPARDCANEITDKVGERRSRLIGALNAHIARIENRTPHLAVRKDGSGLSSLGVPEIDARLSTSEYAGGLETAALHEIRAETALDSAAAAGFALALGGLLSGFSGPIFWIAGSEVRREAGEFYGPGLRELGTDPARLIRIFAGNGKEALWAAGEIAAGSGTRTAAGFCLLELRGNPPIAGLAFSRRLALRARAAGMPVLLLRQSGVEEASAAATRWRISPAPSTTDTAGGGRFVGVPAWHAALEKSRGGQPGAWTLEWNRDERLFALCRTPLSQAASAGTRHVGLRDNSTGRNEALILRSAVG